MKHTGYLHVFSEKEKEELLKKLEESYGITKAPGNFIRRGKERIFYFTGELSFSQIKTLEQLLSIERAGAYIAKETEEGHIRLSIEGTQLFKEQITKNMIELDAKQMEEWMMGRELLIPNKGPGFVVMMYAGEPLGTGKASKEKITNFIPKSRRLKDRG